MERTVDRHEPNREDLLPLREGDLGLVETSGSLNGSESAGEAVQCLGGTSDNEVSRAVVQRNEKLRVGWQERVGLADVLFEILELKTVDTQHGRGYAFVVLHRIFHELGLQCEEREEFLSSKTNVKEELKSLEGVSVERFVRVGSGDGNGGNDTLRVTGGPSEPVPHFSGVEIGDFACHEVLNELRQTDQGHR